MKHIFIVGMLSLVCGVFTSCDKFLSEKSDRALTIPTKLEDLQALLNNNTANNSRGVLAGDASADDFFLPDATYHELNTDIARNLYRWNGADIFDLTNNEWQIGYSAMYYATSVLEGLNGIVRTPNNEAIWDDLKGQALTVRAFRYLSFVTTWSKAYQESSAHTDMGIPLRRTTDFNEPSVRASVEETYRTILDDLKEAVPLLNDVPSGINLASKPLAYATLARTYLFMRKYEEAGRYADSALRLNSTLLDYNEVTGTVFPNYLSNPEIIYYLTAGSATSNLVTNVARHRTDTVLYDAFEENDLRKVHFFRINNDGLYSFKGNYSGAIATKFSGVSVAELYLMRAECYARQGKIVEAMNDLNILLRNRYDRTKPFSPAMASNKEEALAIVLQERRKELIFRGLRWPDIKRLNLEGANIVLKRIIDNETYTLLPNDNRYALPIPEDVIELSGMPQNPQ